jgi:hypothetical protein
MKYSIIPLILLLFSCEPAIQRTPRIKEIPNRMYDSKVKKVIEYHCDKYWKNETPLKISKNSCKICEILEFNPDGILIKSREWWYFDYPNEPNQTRITRVNESGLIIERVSKMTGYSPSEVKTVFSYNQAGFETEKVTYRNGVFLSRVEKIYDEFNCPIKEIFYDENNEIRSYLINKFDILNRITSSEEYTKNDSLSGKWSREYEKDNDDWIVTNTYDAHGNIIERRDRRESYKMNKLDYEYTRSLPYEGFSDIEYFSNGKVKTWHFINSFNKDVYQTYDENGRIIERKIYDNEEWLETFTWKYREDDALIEESESTSKIAGKPFFKKTTYYRVDSNGDWIEKYTIDIEGNVYDLAVREFEYY